MTGKPRRCTVRGKRRWYVDTKDSLTGKRRREFFATETAAGVRQDEINRTPKPTRTIDPLLDADVTLGTFAADYIWQQVATGVWTRVGPSSPTGSTCSCACAASVSARLPPGLSGPSESRISPEPTPKRW